MEVFIARDLYGLSLDDWKHLTGTFTFGSGPTKAELDEIIRQSLRALGNLSEVSRKRPGTRGAIQFRQSKPYPARISRHDFCLLDGAKPKPPRAFKPADLLA